MGYLEGIYELHLLHPFAPPLLDPRPFFSGGLSLCDTMCVSVESVKR